MLTRHEPKLIKGSLDKNDAKAVYLAVEGAPPGTTPPGRLTPLPVALALQAEGFPRKEAAELESALRAAGDPKEPVANLCPVLLGHALGAQVKALVRDHRVCGACGQQGCGATMPAPMEAAAAWAAAFDAAFDAALASP